MTATAETLATPPTAAASNTATSNTTASAQSGDALAITSFVLGFVGIVTSYVPIVPIIGFILGLVAKRRNLTQTSLANWGIGINGVILAIWAAGLALLGFLAAFGIFAALPLWF